eukprot:gene2379-3130_t
MDFDPTLLRAFVAVKETGGFTRAAQRLHLTQSAVSRQIRRLEEQVGRPLLHRTTRRLTVTEDGEDFLRYAQQILDTLDEMTRRFQPSPISGVVRFGAPDNFMGDRLPPLLSQFARAFPATRMEVSVSMHLDLRAMIRAGELDLVVGRMSDPRLMGGLSFELLHTEPLVFAVRAGHPLALKAASVQAVLGYPLVVYGEGTIPRHNTESFLSARGLVLPTNALQTLDVAVAR